MPYTKIAKYVLKGDNLMRITYIAIEKDVEGFERHKSIWKSRGVNGIRADTMTEGIEKAIELEKSKAESLYFISIVAGDIYFMPQLEVLSAETNAPILITALKADDDERENALNNGADYYGGFLETPDRNVSTVTAVINSISRRALKNTKPLDTIIHNNLLLSTAYRRGFVNDAEIELTRTEFDTLHYFLCNRGIAHTFEKIYNHVWGNEHAESVEEAVRSVIKRLRKKIDNPNAVTSFIENIRGVGFRLAENFE